MVNLCHLVWSHPAANRYEKTSHLFSMSCIKTKPQKISKALWEQLFYCSMDLVNVKDHHLTPGDPTCLQVLTKAWRLKQSMTTFPFTLWMGSTTTPTALGFNCSKLCWVLMSLEPGRSVEGFTKHQPPRLHPANDQTGEPCTWAADVSGPSYIVHVLWCFSVGGEIKGWRYLSLEEQTTMFEKCFCSTRNGCTMIQTQHLLKRLIHPS